VDRRSGRSEGDHSDHFNKSNWRDKKYSGVPIHRLLDAAQMDPGASKVIFLADDGSTAEVDLVELNACPD
jgi:hypothetical protein